MKFIFKDQIRGSFYSFLYSARKGGFSDLFLAIALLCPGLSNAERLDGTEIRTLPLLWCVVEGSQTEQDPGSVGAIDGEPEATRSIVLWRRHERASDRVFIPQTGVTFRSGMDRFRISNEFPVIPDPDLSRDNPGDIRVWGNELQDVISSCEQAWIDLLRDHGHTFIPMSLPGIPVINARHIFREEDGSVVRGTATPVWSCGDLNNIDTFTPTGGHIIFEDRTYSTGDETRLIAHEFGHILSLFHTSIRSNLMGSPGNGIELVSNILDMTDWRAPGCFTGAFPRTINQIGWVQAEAQDWPGNMLDPPGALLPGPSLSFPRIDTHRDVPADEPYIDLSAIVVHENSAKTILKFTHRVLGLIEPSIGKAELNYWILADLDDDVSTGGEPSEYPSDVPTKSLSGVDLITHVQRKLNSQGKQILKGTLWQYRNGSFMPITEGVNTFFERLIDHHHKSGPAISPLFDNVSIQFPGKLSLSVTRAAAFRIQGCTHNAATGTVDCLDDALKGLKVSLEPPVFPVCSVMPDPARSGETVSVRVSGLDPDAPIHVVFGDAPVAIGRTDSKGGGTVNFEIPSNSRTGLRLVTVGVDGTALTADCTLEVAKEKMEKLWLSWIYVITAIFGVLVLIHVASRKRSKS